MPVTACDLARDIVDELRQRDSLIVASRDAVDDEWDIEIDDEMILLIERRVLSALRDGGIAP